MQAQWRQAAVNVSTAELFLITLIYTRERCFLSFERPRLKPNGTEDKSASCGVSVVHWGFDVSSSYFPTLSMNTCSLGPLLFCLSSMTFLQVSHLPSCVPSLPAALSTYPPSPLPFLQEPVPALLTQGTAPTPNTAELKQTHFARMKTNHFPFSLLSLSLTLSLSTPFPLVLFLS